MMGRSIGIETVVYVPADVHVTTRELIRDEGAEVVVAQGGGYDGTVGEAKERVQREGEHGLLVMDIAWEGYEDVPKVRGVIGILSGVGVGLLTFCTVGCGGISDHAGRDR